MMKPARRRVAACATLLLSSIGLSGCALLGVAANAMPLPPVKPKVVLAGQSVGVMVWADRGLRASWPNAQKDLGGAVEYNLKTAQDAKAKELENVTFPYPAESYVKWQRAHPDAEVLPAEEIAARLPVHRLIYAEIENLGTRSPNAVNLYRGTMTIALKVFDVDPTAKTAKSIYEERITVSDRKASTEDGRPDSSDPKIYNDTLRNASVEVAKRFIEHPAEEDK